MRITSLFGFLDDWCWDSFREYGFCFWVLRLRVCCNKIKSFGLLQQSKHVGFFFFVFLQWLLLLTSLFCCLYSNEISWMTFGVSMCLEKVFNFGTKEWIWGLVLLCSVFFHSMCVQCYLLGRKLDKYFSLLFLVKIIACYQFKSVKKNCFFFLWMHFELGGAWMLNVRLVFIFLIWVPSG